MITKLAMNDTVPAQMQGIRREIDRDLQDVSKSARSMVDWKHYVKAYPWVCLGAAAALGFLIVPKRSAAACADLPAPTEPANTRHPVAPSVRTAARGVFEALVGAVAGIAVREVIAYLGQNAERILAKASHPETNHHDPSCSS